MIDVLLADDNPKVRASVRMVLEFDKINRYNIQEVYNGKEAVFASQAKAYDICLMDVDMPVMNGIEAARKIHSLRPFGYMPIIAVTGERLESLPTDVFDDYVEKPFQSDELLKKIAESSVFINIFEPDLQNFSKELPMDKEQLEKLKELRKDNLGFLMLRGTRDMFITHKYIQNKISHDFASGKFLSEFLDRNPDHPGNVHIFKDNTQANQWILTPEEMAFRIKEEDALLSEGKYKSKAEKAEVKGPTV